MSDETFITIKASDEEAEAWKGAAERSAMSRHAWLKLMVNIACGRSSIADFVRRVKAARKAEEENAPIPYALKSGVGVENNTHEQFERLAARAASLPYDLPLRPTLTASSTPNQIGEWLQAFEPWMNHSLAAREVAGLEPYFLFEAWAAVADLLQNAGDGD